MVKPQCTDLAEKRIAGIILFDISLRFGQDFCKRPAREIFGKILIKLLDLFFGELRGIADQLVDRDVKVRCKLRQNHDVGCTLPRFPFGNGCFGDTDKFGELFLGYFPFPSETD